MTVLQVHGAKLNHKIENDIHCDHMRATMSPLYKPVPQAMNISQLANVKEYFPNLAKLAGLDETEQLPFIHDVFRAKIMWTVLYKGVVGEVSKQTHTRHHAVAHPLCGQDTGQYQMPVVLLNTRDGNGALLALFVINRM